MKILWKPDGQFGIPHYHEVPFKEAFSAGSWMSPFSMGWPHLLAWDSGVSRRLGEATHLE